MKTINYLFLIFFVFLVSSVSYSQKNNYDSSREGYSAKLKIAVNSDFKKENIKIEGMLFYGIKKGKYDLLLYMENVKDCMFDIVKHEYSINTDSEILKNELDGDHIAIDLSAFALIIPAKDLLEFNSSEKVILNVVLLKKENEYIKVIPVKIDLKPEKTNVYMDFYNFSLKDKN